METNVTELLSVLRTSENRWRVGMINGPNMSNLKKRDPAIYGAVDDLAQVEEQMQALAAALEVDLTHTICSNHEGEIVDWIQELSDELDGIVINPASLTRFGLSTVHALFDSGLPVVEVHFSNIAALGIPSLFSETVVGVCSGMRRHSYTAALIGLVAMLDDQDFVKPAGYAGPRTAEAEA
jgi:3-dehydroquinate dehydratase-2